MTLPRTGSGYEWDGTIEPPCDNCKQYQDHGCQCQPCGTCSLSTPKGGLNPGVDGRSRCADCHVEYEAELDKDQKLCRERPVYRPTVADLYVVTVEIFARASR